MFLEGENDRFSERRPKGLVRPSVRRCRDTSRWRVFGWRPFGARRFSALPEIDCSDSSPRVRSARSMRHELALSVHAASADVGSGRYSRREREGLSGGRFPAGRSRPPDEGTPAAYTPVVSILRMFRALRQAVLVKACETFLRERRLPGMEGQAPGRGSRRWSRHRGIPWRRCRSLRW